MSWRALFVLGAAFCACIATADDVPSLRNRIGLPKPKPGGQAPVSLPDLSIAPLDAAKLSGALKSAAEVLQPGAAPPTINTATTFTLTPAQARIAQRGTLGFWGPRWISNNPESAYGSAHFAGSAELTNQYAEVRIVGLVSKIVVVDCFVANTDGPAKPDNGGKYAMRVFSLPATGGNLTQDLVGEVTAAEGHVLFALRPNAERTFLRFNRAEGYWNLTRCDVIPAQ